MLDVPQAPDRGGPAQPGGDGGRGGARAARVQARRAVDETVQRARADEEAPTDGSEFTVTPKTGGTATRRIELTAK
ncbi:MAG: hypothetical protein MZU84_04565 [Sphingobacterium sp.]|nr:hypothetical protein [Sphingobacterium sp.]